MLFTKNRNLIRCSSILLSSLVLPTTVESFAGFRSARSSVIAASSFASYSSGNFVVARPNYMPNGSSNSNTRLFSSTASSNMASNSDTKLRVLSEVSVTANDGKLLRISHTSKSTGTDMIFGLFLPSCYKTILKSKSGQSIPALFWLSGLTCNDTNFSMKAGAFEAADKEGIALVMPDTSPRGENVPNDDNYDLGQGAGFYVDATEEPWSEHFKMETYVTKELPAILREKYNVGNVKSITRHSMGGHGALKLAFSDPKSWISVSAFSPIVNPTNCPWGQKAFTNYFGNVDAGKDHDATCLLETKGPFTEYYDDILIDQGLNDEFLINDPNQLLPDNLEKVADKVGQKITLRRQAGHDHSYYFISSFIDDHIKFHSKRLKAAAGKLRASQSVDAGASVEDTTGKPIKCKAMVARAAKQPLVEETIIVDPPKAGEVRVKVIANALCHTGTYRILGVCLFSPHRLKL